MYTCNAEEVIVETVLNALMWRRRPDQKSEVNPERKREAPYRINLKHTFITDRNFDIFRIASVVIILLSYLFTFNYVYVIPRCLC